MNEADKNLTIKISTPAELSGAKAAEAQLNKLTETVKESGKETEKAADKTKESAKQVGAFSLKLGELKGIASKVGQSFPLLGQAMSLAVNPVVTAILIAIKLFSSFKEKIDAMNKSLDEAGERASHGFGNMRESIEDAHRAIIFAYSDISRKLKEFAEQQDDARHRTDNYTAAIRRQEQAMLSLADARATAAEEEIDLQRQLNELDPAKGVSAVDAAKKKAAAHAQEMAEKNKIQDDADQAAISGKNTYLGNAQIDFDRTAAILAPLAAGKEHRDAKLLDLPKVISDLEGKHQEDTASRKDAVTKRDAAQSAMDSYISKPFGDSLGRWGSTYEGLQKNLADAEKSVQDAMQNEARSAKAISANKNELAKFTKEADDFNKAKEAYDKAKESIKDLTHEINELKKAAASASAARHAAAAASYQSDQNKVASQILSGAKPGQGIPPGVVVDASGNVSLAPGQMPTAAQATGATNPEAFQQALNRGLLIKDIQGRLTTEKKAASEEEWQHMIREPNPGENRPHETEHLGKRDEHLANAKRLEDELKLITSMVGQSIGGVRQAVNLHGKALHDAIELLRRDLEDLKRNLHNVDQRQRNSRYPGGG